MGKLIIKHSQRRADDTEVQAKVHVFISVGFMTRCVVLRRSCSVTKMSGWLPGVWKIYGRGEMSRGGVPWRPTFKESQKAGEHRNDIDLHYAKITPHAVNLALVA